MAGTLLHVTLADRAAASADLPAGTREAIDRRRDDFRLGAVLLDLAYYDRLWMTGLRAAAGLDLRFCPWGTLLHVRSPFTFTLSLLDGAGGDPAGRALALGAATHLAVDAVFHADIHARVMREADGVGGLDSLHKSIEDQMDLHVHFDLLGHSGIGTPWAREALGLRPDPSWVERMRGAVAAAHPSAPSAGRMQSWLRNMRLFGIASSAPRIPWARTLPDDDPDLLEASLSLADEAIRRSVDHLEAAAAYLEGRLDRAGLASRIPDVSLADGRPAEPPSPAA